MDFKPLTNPNPEGHWVGEVHFGESNLSLMQMVKSAGAVIALVAAGATGAWYIQETRIADAYRENDSLTRQIDALKNSEGWKFPDTLKHLEEVSSRLNKQFAALDSHQELQKRSAALKAQNEKLESSLAEAERLRESAEKVAMEERDKLKKAFAEGKKLKVYSGSSVELVKNTVTLGLPYLYQVSGAQVIVDNVARNLNVGEHVTFEALGRKCRVTLLTTDKQDTSADFMMVCADGAAI